MKMKLSSSLLSSSFLIFLIILVAGCVVLTNAQSNSSSSTTTEITTTSTATTSEATTTTTAETSTSTYVINTSTNVTQPITVDPNATKPTRPEFAIPDEIATPMLWAAGPVSICAMLFGGSPVNGLYSTSALAVVEFSICFRDLVDQPLRFPETAWPGWTVGRPEGQHIRGALVSNIICQISLVIILFCVGAVLTTLKSAVKKQLARRKVKRSGLNATLLPGNLAQSNANQSQNANDDDDNQQNTLWDRVGIAVWYPGSYILVASIFLEGIVASIIRLVVVIGPDALDIFLCIVGGIVVSQVMVVAWTVVSQSFHGAGPVRFTSGYIRVPKEYHESVITQFLRSNVAATFFLGNYLWCAKKGTEDSRNNVLPGPARPAGLLVLPFRARNLEESGIIALATRYFFVESCFAFVFAIARGIMEPCEVMIWIIAGVSLMSTLLLIRVRPFNIPFYNTTAVWSNGAITASAICIAMFYTGWVGPDAKLAGEVIAMTAALGGALPFFLYLVKFALMKAVRAELCPVGLQDEEDFASPNKDGSGSGKGGAGGDGAGGDGSGGNNANLNSLEDDLELEAFLSNAKQPVNWPLRRAGELKLSALPKQDFDESNLFVKKDDNRNQRPSIFSAEGQAERERLRQKRPKNLPLEGEEKISPIPSPLQNMSPSSGGVGGGYSPSGSGSLSGSSRNRQQGAAAGASPIIGSSSAIRFSGSGSSPARPSSVPDNVPPYGCSPLMEAYTE